MFKNEFNKDDIVRVKIKNHKYNNEMGSVIRLCHDDWYIVNVKGVEIMLNAKRKEMELIKTPKENFKFIWLKPCLDWFEQKTIELEEETYTYYKIQRRFGPSWWITGINFVEKPKYHREETQIGEISACDLKKFIDWCKTEGGSKIIEISAISGNFDIIEEIKKL